MASWPVLFEGSSDSASIRTLQTVLNLLGEFGFAGGALPPLVVDGRYTIPTVQAVANFQRTYHLAVTGFAGPEVFNKLALIIAANGLGVLSTDPSGHLSYTPSALALRGPGISLSPTSPGSQNAMFAAAVALALFSVRLRRMSLATMSSALAEEGEAPATKEG